MKARIVLLALVAFLLLGSGATSTGAAPPRLLAVGVIQDMQISPCEHPWHPGQFLHYHLTDGCGRRLFLSGDITSDMVGATVWADGVLLIGTPHCRILEIDSFSVCPP